MMPGWVVTREVLAVDLEDPVHAREGDRQRALDAGRRRPTARSRRRAGRSGRRARRTAGRARRPPPSPSGSATASGQARREVGGLVAPVRLAVGVVGQEPHLRQAGAIARRRPGPSPRRSLIAVSIRPPGRGPGATACPREPNRPGAPLRDCGRQHDRSGRPSHRFGATRPFEARAGLPATRRTSRSSAVARCCPCPRPC